MVLGGCFENICFIGLFSLGKVKGLREVLLFCVSCVRECYYWRACFCLCVQIHLWVEKSFGTDVLIRRKIQKVLEVAFFQSTIAISATCTGNRNSFRLSQFPMLY